MTIVTISLDASLGHCVNTPAKILDRLPKLCQNLGTSFQKDSFGLTIHPWKKVNLDRRPRLLSHPHFANCFLISACPKSFKRQHGGILRAFHYEMSIGTAAVIQQRVSRVGPKRIQQPRMALCPMLHGQEFAWSHSVLLQNAHSKCKEATPYHG